MENNNAIVRLESGSVLVEVIPLDGGRISRLYDKVHDCELIWSNPRTSNVKRYYNCNYDDLSASGIEEAFPTVQPCVAGDTALPFFGEVWTIPWQSEQRENEVVLECFSPVWTAKLCKKLCLEDNVLTVEYEITNTHSQAFHYIFGFHPSLCIYKGSQLYMPKGSYDMYLAPDMKKGAIESFAWPWYRDRDLSDIDMDAETEFYNFLTCPVTQGCYGIRHPQKNTGLKIEFDANYFKCLSIWPIYGGFRGHKCIMTEAFSAWPAQLDLAVDNGIAYVVEGGGKILTAVKYTVGCE